jgi:hypothetical protein
MSSTTLTQAQLQQVIAVQTANPGNAAATWAALFSFGDQYAAAALQGLTNAQSTYGQVISNSNLVSGVTGDQVRAIQNSIAAGYVNLLKQQPLNSDGTIDLLKTTEIETNYYNATTSNGAPATAAIDLSVAVLAQNGYTNGGNWYTSFGGVGLNLDPARIGPASPLLSNIPVGEAAGHFLETAALTVLTGTANSVVPGPLNSSEDAMLAALKAIHAAANDLVPGANGGDLIDPTLRDGGITVTPVNFSFEAPTGEKIDVSIGDAQATIGKTDDVGEKAITAFDIANNQPWSLETSTFDAYQRLQSQRVVLDSGRQQIKQYDPNNTHPYDELDIDEDATGKPTGVQTKLDGQPNNNADFSSVGQSSARRSAGRWRPTTSSCRSRPAP